ncbi:MAG TPA: hypothetical protein VMG63_20830, partial [Terriglobia bacterium]|nr:hypothetical protein [Terriglobia bacterium]
MALSWTEHVLAVSRPVAPRRAVRRVAASLAVAPRRAVGRVAAVPPAGALLAASLAVAPRRAVDRVAAVPRAGALLAASPAVAPRLALGRVAAVPRVGALLAVVPPVVMPARTNVHLVALPAGRKPERPTRGRSDARRAHERLWRAQPDIPNEADCSFESVDEEWQSP